MAQLDDPHALRPTRRARLPAAALALLATLSPLGGCGFAVRHPASTAAIAGVTIGLTTCEIGTDFEEHPACGAVGLGAAVLLGGAVLLATALGGPGDTVLREPDADERPARPTIEDAPGPTIEDAPGPTIEDAPAPAP